jgi:hypothetical protein
VKVESLGEIIAERRFILPGDDKQETLFSRENHRRSPSKQVFIAGTSSTPQLRPRAQFAESDKSGRFLRDADDQGDPGFPVPEGKKE